MNLIYLFFKTIDLGGFFEGLLFLLCLNISAEFLIILGSSWLLEMKRLRVVLERVVNVVLAFVIVTFFSLVLIPDLVFYTTHTPIIKFYLSYHLGYSLSYLSLFFLVLQIILFFIRSFLWDIEKFKTKHYSHSFDIRREISYCYRFICYNNTSAYLFNTTLYFFMILPIRLVFYGVFWRIFPILSTIIYIMTIFFSSSFCSPFLFFISFLYFVLKSTIRINLIKDFFLFLGVKDKEFIDSLFPSLSEEILKRDECVIKGTIVSILFIQLNSLVNFLHATEIKWLFDESQNLAIKEAQYPLLISYDSSSSVNEIFLLLKTKYPTMLELICSLF